MKATSDKEQSPWLLLFVAAIVLIGVLLMAKNAKAQSLAPKTQAVIHAVHQP